MLRIVLKGVIFALGLVAFNQAFACSCARSDPDEAFEKSVNVFVAVPMEAAVVGEAEQPQGIIQATLTVLDVLKGPAPDADLVMEATVDPQSTACQTSISLGSAYVIFLTDASQSTVRPSVCGPHETFQHLRMRLEEACYPGHPYNEEWCAPNLLEALRGARKANRKYHFNEEWELEFEEYAKRRAESLNHRRQEQNY
ncbi:hypothetical protein [Parahaliea aestuarii]|uniref:Uncharacterized protein n=1 Tax=Parahaliea aestuarii TaxID=1852021 RepID=A0A5C8ZJX8_9GAMM|nr:hypothetical protein [Parahaliea aestuarii]TXS88916.1 hypothetical protein FVW59_19395 [Parahaliea aestuarii]